MKLFNKIVLLGVIVMGVSSCEINNLDDSFRNNDEKLCGRVWERSYVTDNDDLCTQLLEFRAGSIGRTGTEFFEYRQKDRNGNWNDIPYRTASYSFYWQWTDNEREGIIIEHSIDGTLYFDNVWVRINYLSGNLDGEEVTFYRR
ncbi:hypothetical protein EZS27_039052 [termite gut metagenome]|uniref:Lipocalin-like domain-containing protein n=2 Tax=termite gut metagenome TaxID=433724 RepID=A0A5J4PJI3_9ZZZZ